VQPAAPQELGQQRSSQHIQEQQEKHIANALAIEEKAQFVYN
jgi:hypothetical protein